MTATRFELHRGEDVTGVSGEGVVADGVRFSDGRAVVRWRGPRTSIVLWASVDDAMAVHGHDGRTRFVDVEVLDSVEDQTLTGLVDAALDGLNAWFGGACAGA